MLSALSFQGSRNQKPQLLPTLWSQLIQRKPCKHSPSCQIDTYFWARSFTNFTHRENINSRFVSLHSTCNFNFFFLWKTLGKLGIHSAPSFKSFLLSLYIVYIYIYLSLYIYMYECFVYTCVHATSMPGALRDQERALDLWNWSHRYLWLVGAGNRTRVFWKRNSCS